MESLIELIGIKVGRRPILDRTQRVRRLRLTLFIRTMPGGSFGAVPRKRGLSMVQDAASADAQGRVKAAACSESGRFT
jgi:hypothetical protein